LSAHPVVSEPAELGADDFPSVAIGGAHRSEMNRNVHAGDGVLLHAHDRKLEAMDHILRGDMDDGRTIHFEMQLIEGDHVILRVAAGPEAIENVQKVGTPEYEQYEHQPVGPYDEVVDFVSMRRIVRRHVASQELPQRAPPSIR